ncbi:hypothetical protein HS088_TW23G00113 [Tripterygium wilfordii]|uniref:UBL3-like ubiquitin domain-containing protein n=1 Tax=Tripterygium wilfordii TaxID=458696 RepID=A0A7J7BTV7_TRIWF|nr:hypothetical protein HS088_TW23G00113 [Tripterygium wilfordii]
MNKDSNYDRNQFNRLTKELVGEILQRTLDQPWTFAAVRQRFQKFVMAGAQDQVEIRFRLMDGSDIGPKSFSAATSVATLKESILIQWPRGWYNFSIRFQVFFNLSNHHLAQWLYDYKA